MSFQLDRHLYLVGWKTGISGRILFRLENLAGIHIIWRVVRRRKWHRYSAVGEVEILDTK